MRWIARCVALAAAAGVAAGAGARGMTPEDVARTAAVTAAEMAPGGGAVAVVRAVPRNPFAEPNGPAWRRLFVVEAASGRERPFVTGRASVSAVRWLPDGSGIAFLARRDGDEHRSLWVIPADGGEARRVLGLETDIRQYDVAPGGDRVAAVAAQPEDPERRRLRERGFDRIVFEEELPRVRVWVAPLDGSAPPRPLALEGAAFEAAWAPDGRRLAVTLAPRPLTDDRYMFRRIVVVDAGSGEVLARVANPGKLGHFAWSPDGRHLAMVSGADLHDPAAGRLMVADAAAGGAPRDLLPGLEAHVTGFAWTGPDRLVALLARGTRSELLEVWLDGRRREIPLPGREVFTALSADRTGRRLALVGEAADHPPEAYLLDLEGGTPRRLTDSNPWLAEVELAPQRTVRFRVRDGLELEGVLVEPLHRRPGERVPAVLMVHGGPESHVRDGWVTGYSRPAQVLAARGFAVLFPNYRGSTGRGVAFSKLGQGDPAGKEFDDLVDAADFLVRSGLADPERIGVTGGSYGGYATAWLATRYSERFAAGVMFVGISDKISKAGTTDIPQEEYLVHARRFPYEDFRLFLERSPIFWVERARTPLLILHGKDDPRVNVGQSLELYRALRNIGRTPVRLVLYPGEGHGNRRAAGRYDLCRRLVRWFEHYLVGPGGEPPPPDVDVSPLERGAAGGRGDG